MSVSMTISVFATDADLGTVPTDLEPSNARHHMQLNYILNTGQEVIRFLDRYQVIYNETASVEALEEFSDGLLKYGKDPIVADIFDYVPEKEFKVKISRDSFVVPSLQKIESIVYQKGKTWVLDSATLPDEYEGTKALDLAGDICMAVVNENHCKKKITGYCLAPDPNVINPGGQMRDGIWCEHWHDFVMPHR